MDYLSALQEFHKAVFIKTGMWPADIGQSFIPNNETARLREFLHNEECGEINDVLIGNDDDLSKAHLLKEICDLLYVTLGTAVVYFEPEVIQEAFSRVHENNMDKITRGTIGENGKLIKPADHEKVYLKDLTGEDRALVPYSSDYRCVHGHDKCNEMYPGPDCPYCEQV